MIRIFFKDQENIALLFLMAGVCCFLFGVGLDVFVIVGLCLVGIGFLFWYKNSPLGFFDCLFEFYPIRWWIFCTCGLWIMACISLFFCKDVFLTLKGILGFAIIPAVLMCLFYLVFKRSSNKSVFFIFYFLFFILMMCAIGTIIKFVQNHQYGRTAVLDSTFIVPFAVYLLLAFVFCLSLLFFSRLKCLAILSLEVVLVAIYFNETRSAFVAVTLICFLICFYLKYPYKKIIVSFGVLLMIGMGFGIYSWSGKQGNPRYDFQAMSERIGVVWDYMPAEMGRFDYLCFNHSYYQCSSYSGKNLDQRFIFESSALNRLALWKSALLIFWEYKFFPMIGYSSKAYSQNLMSRNLREEILPYPYSDYKNKILLNPHLHNGFLSAFLEMGLFGGIFYLASFVLLLYYGWKHKNFYGFILFFSVLGVSIMSNFDIVLGFVSPEYFFYIVCGIFLGIIHRKDSAPIPQRNN